MSRKTLRQPLAALVLIIGAAGINTANACSSNGYLGTLNVFAGNFAIRGCAYAHGQLLDIAGNTALFALLGTTYGGDGRTTFALPDTRGRSVVGAGTGPGLSNIRLGQRGGLESVVLTVANMPAHTHAATAEVEVTGLEATLNGYFMSWSEAPADQNSPTVQRYLSGWKTVLTENVPNVTLSSMSIDIVVGDDPSATVNVASTGGSAAVNIRDPYIGMYWLIQTEGIFPPRN